jgi:hypothetical protein
MKKENFVQEILNINDPDNKVKFKKALVHQTGAEIRQVNPITNWYR